MQRLILYCNTKQYPLKEFIDRTLGSGRRPRPTDLGMRWPPYTQEELENEFDPPPLPFEITEHMISWVRRPADRIAFKNHETPGACVGHTAVIVKADFQ